MDRMIAICGLMCSDCPASIATEKDDDEERKRVAELWSSDEYPLVPEDINCDGCVAVGGRLLSFCQDCLTRRCGLERGVANCAYCDDYSCEQLDGHLEQVQAAVARARLEEIRRGVQA